jgi:hypothetical protein
MKYSEIKKLFAIFSILIIGFVGLTSCVNVTPESYDHSRRGTRNGDDWSNPIEITQYDYTYVPSPTSIVVDSKGDWHIVYTDRIRYEDKTQRHFIKYKNPQSTEILAEAYGNIFNDTGGGLGFPSIALDPDEGLHVTYTHWVHDELFNQSIMYLKKEAGSSSWSTTQEIAKFEYVWIPSRSSIAVDSNGDWHIVYPDRDRHEDGFKRRYIRYKNKSSTTTLAEGYGNIFRGEGEGVGHPSIAIDPNGDLHVTYIYIINDDVFNQTVMYTTKGTGSHSWSTPQEITIFEYSFIPSYSSIAADSDGDWHIVYPDRIRYEDNSDRRYIKYKNKASTEILAERYGHIWNDTGEGVGCPSIAIDLNGDLHVIYTHIRYDDTGNQSIMYTNREAPDKSSPATDTDKDGLADNWEIEHFGNLSQDASGDFDNDGYTNIQEYKEGSNPIDSLSKPSAKEGVSILDYWWIFLIIIVVIVALIAGISQRKRSSAIPKQDLAGFQEERVKQTTTDTKDLPPPPPPPPPSK